MTTKSAREAATAHLQQAGEAINAMFDRHDELVETITKLTTMAESDANTFTRAQQLIDGASQLTEQVKALRAAALNASEHRAKRDLARDLNASPNALFPPQPARTAADLKPVADATHAA